MARRPPAEDDTMPAGPDSDPALARDLSAPPAAADSIEALMARAVRAPGRDEPPPLAPGTMVIGRYRVERMLGAGGMGAVYLAHDTQLERAVAVKVLHQVQGGARLRREALALARLAHPNVVHVYEVAELDGRPIIAMEYVPGMTLRGWLAAAPRSVDAILDAIAAAGAGLVAAHGAGLVHRDLKLDNLLVGDDGRVRVIDFGLARGAGEMNVEADVDPGATPPPARAVAVSPSGSVSRELSAPLTATGAVMGTPAYMAPEQFLGGMVDARADQFALCVVAWEALWRRRPFDGDSIQALAEATYHNQLVPPPPRPRVPAGVRAALERGLSADAARRFPDVAGLLAALAAARGHVRRRRLFLLGGAGVMVAAGAAALVLHARGPALPACDDVDVDLAGLPDPAAAVRARGGDVAAATRIGEGRGAFVARLHAGTRAACQRAPGWSAQAQARAADCLDTQRALAARLLALPAAARAGDTVELVSRATTLPDPSDCVAPAFVASEVPLIAPERRDAAVAARAELGVVFAALDLYQLAVARRAVTALAAAPGADDPLVVAGLAIARAVLDARAGHHDGKALSAAYFAARALDADELAARALAELVDSNSVEGSDVWLRSARSDADRMRARRPAAAAGLYLKVAKVTDEHGDHPAALELVGRARALLAPTDPRRATASAIEGSVRIGQGDVAAGNAAYADAVALMTSLRGATHPDVAQLHSDHAAVLLNVDRGRDALPFVAAARAALASAGDEESGLLDRVRGNLGAVLIDVGYAAEARPLLETARAHLQVVDPDGPDLAHLDGNLALIELDGGKPALALAMLGDALAVYERAGTADELEAAGVYYNLAAVQQASDPPAAIRAATRAAAIYGARAPGGDRQRNSLIMIAAIANATGDPTTALAQSSAALAFPHPAQDAQTQAWAQLEEARALIALHKWPAEARRLLTEARAAYAAAPLPKRVAQVDALLRTLPR